MSEKVFVIAANNLDLLLVNAESNLTVVIPASSSDVDSVEHIFCLTFKKL